MKKDKTDKDLGEQLAYTVALAKLPGRRNRATGWLKVSDGSLTFQGVHGGSCIILPLDSKTRVSQTSIFGMINYGFKVQSSNGDTYTFEPLESSGRIRNLAMLVRSMIERESQLESEEDSVETKVAVSA